MRRLPQETIYVGLEAAKDRELIDRLFHSSLKNGRIT
jgi:hypothetical protein